jgi:starvation-inducible DNA-binding protein
VKNSTIEEITNESDSTACVKDVVDSFSVLLEIERDILHAADEAGDDGTSDMMASYIREQEKLVWMYSSFLK